MKSYSQIKQDVWILEKLNHKKNGFFVDIGAYDGVELSNTFILEKEYDWNGICLECNPLVLKSLKENRIAKICDRPIWNKNDETFYLNIPSINDQMLSYIDTTNRNNGIKLNPSIDLNTLLEEYGAPKNIDYISMDIEGVELSVLLTFDFNKYNVKCWTIEHNLEKNNQNSLSNFINIAFILLQHNYLVKWHDWDIFAIKDTIEPEFIVDGERIK
jgi:FkbM family methyltransferase